MNHSEMIDYLRKHSLLRGEQVRLTPLSGGVSSDIILVEQGDTKFVVKQSLEKLRVNDEWHCSTARNITECDAIRYASRIMPQNVPAILHADPLHRLFVMEYFGSDFLPWKTHLLSGNIDLDMGRRIGELLATLHTSSWLVDDLRSRFDTRTDFFALRVEPYLLTTGERNPALKAIYYEEADRLQQTSLALVHGDWSAKNLLVSKERTIILDWEVACLGDPAFDAAFFLNLIYLKSLFCREQIDRYVELMHIFRSAYGQQVYQLDKELDQRILRLTLMLMLARIDGKSPVEYITSEADKQMVRSFTTQALLDEVNLWSEVDRRWKSAVMML